MIIVTQYFETEHIIPLSDFKSFKIEIEKHIEEALYHYHEIIVELDEVSHQTGTSINLDKLINVFY